MTKNYKDKMLSDMIEKLVAGIKENAKTETPKRNRANSQSDDEKEIISIEEMHELIEKACDEFVGLGNNLSAAIGVLVMSRLFGWQTMRLVSARNDWERANKIFGDIKKIMPKRGKYARKSIGLDIADQAGEYWKIIRGEIETIPEKIRRLFNNDYKNTAH